MFGALEVPLGSIVMIVSRTMLQWLKELNACPPYEKLYLYVRLWKCNNVECVGVMTTAKCGHRLFSRHGMAESLAS